MHTPSVTELRRGLRAEMHRTLYPVASACIALYALYALSHPFVVGGPEGWVLCAVALASCGFFAGVVHVLPRTAPEARLVSVLTAATPMVLAANSLLHLALVLDPKQTTNLMLVLIAAGYLLLFTRPLVLVVVATFVAWGAIVWHVPSPDWPHFAYALVSALAVGGLIHFVRREMTLRTVRMHLEDVHLRQALEQALADKEEAYEAARELAEVKSTILDMVSHEVRTPLTGIIGFAEVLEGETEGQAEEFARLIRESAQRLFSTLNALLELSRLEAGAVEVEGEPVDLAHAAAGVLEQLAAQARAKGLTCRVEQEAESPVVLMLDPIFFDRILINLVGNAIKFTERGRVTVRVWRSAEGAGVSVEDTGLGMEASFLPHAFEPFRQESNGLSRLHQGSGLGLAITKQLTELMGGTVAVESTLGVGSCFTVSFPLSAVAVAQGRLAGSRHERPRTHG